MREHTRTGLIQVFDSNATVYDSNPVPYFRPIARRLVALVTPRPGDRVLDVGCGRGAVLQPLAEAVGADGSVVGIDITEGMIRETSAQLAADGPGNVEVRLMDGSAPRFPPASFDVITGSFSIIMIPDLATVFANYATLLRPGGRLAFTSPMVTATRPTWPLGPFDFEEMMDAAEDQDGAIGGFRETLAELVDEVLVGHLRSAGFAHIQVNEESFTITAPGVDELIDWSWTHGMRMIWERMDEDTRAEHRARITERSQSYVRPDGSVSFDVPVRYVIAGLR